MLHFFTYYSTIFLRISRSSSLCLHCLPNDFMVMLWGFCHKWPRLFLQIKYLTTSYQAWLFFFSCIENFILLNWCGLLWSLRSQYSATRFRILLETGNLGTRVLSKVQDNFTVVIMYSVIFLIFCIHGGFSVCKMWLMLLLGINMYLFIMIIMVFYQHWRLGVVGVHSVKLCFDLLNQV